VTFSFIRDLIVSGVFTGFDVIEEDRFHTGEVHVDVDISGILDGIPMHVAMNINLATKFLRVHREVGEPNAAWEILQCVDELHVRPSELIYRHVSLEVVVTWNEHLTTRERLQDAKPTDIPRHISITDNRIVRFDEGTPVMNDLFGVIVDARNEITELWDCGMLQMSIRDYPDSIHAYFQIK
jgi:hypothetical protein